MVTDNDTTTGFQAKHHDEDFQFYFRQHWVRVMPAIFKMLIANTLVITIGYYTLIDMSWDNTFTRRLTLLVLSGAFIIANIDFLYHFYRYFLNVVVVTDKKLHRIKKTLLTTDDHRSIDLWSLQDIRKAQHGLFQNIFRFGSITLEAQESVIRLHFVPNVNKKYADLMALQERARNRAADSFRQAKRRALHVVPESEQALSS